MDTLRERILDGIYAPHSQIHSEHELCAMSGVSRITVRPTTLGKPHAAAARAALVNALDDTYWHVRLRAARALGYLRDAQAAPAVAELLSHAIRNLRKEAALAHSHD